MNKLAAVVLLSFWLGWMSTSGTKSQLVRLFDVFVFGPVLIWAGRRLQSTLDWFLVVFGASTMGYNWRNYRRH